jgi:uncharacterized FAD-dependent dehydrogenase
VRPQEILYVSKPHIGTFKLVTMVENIARRNRFALGGEIRFGEPGRAIDIERRAGARRVATADGEHR